MSSSVSLSTFFFLSFFFRYTLSASVSYTQHCSSVVPESTTTVRTYHDPLPFQFASFYFTGGDTFFRPTNQATNQTYSFGGRSVRLRFVQNYYETTAAGVYKVQASFLIRSPYNQYYSNNISNNRARSGSGYGGSYYRKRAARGSVRFSLTGFWSGVSRKLCMVGSASWQVEQTRAAVDLAAVLKVNYAAAENPDIHTAAVAGSFQSTSPSSANDPGYFDPILLFDFPVSRDYNYSLVPFSTDSEFPKNQSLDLQTALFCSLLSSRIESLELAYDAVDDCRESRRHCSPLAGSSSPPRFLSLRSIQCLGGEPKLRFTANFQNVTYGYDQDFSLDSTFVGEASWDEANNHLSGVLCRLLNPIDNPSNAVGDCTTRFILRYPSIWSIRSDAKVNGRLWSIKPVNDSSYFRKIDLKSPDEIDAMALPGMKYDYTESDRVRNLCPTRKKLPKNGSIYPDGHSYDMRFDLSLKNSNGEQIGWGYATPISVGIDLFERSSTMFVAVDAFAPESAPQFADVEERTADSSPLNISYTVSINYFRTANSTNPQDRMYLTAEGVYDPKTGYLCMVGCRKIHNYSTSVNDCELLVKFEFAPTNENRGGFTKGTIESTRPKSDPLYFKELTFSSTSYFTEQAVETISRMDLEIAMVLISNTLSCVFVAVQIFHGRRNPEVQSCISIAMLVVLSLGHMIPLVLNFEALFLGSHTKQTFLMSSGKWLEANEVAIRVVTMVAFLLQIRLLQSVWSAKETDDTRIEKKASFISLAVYVFGGFIALLLNWTRAKISPSPSSYNGDLGISSTLWGDVRSYAGLILDGFLLPQIVLNAIRGGLGRTALSGPFYVGTSAVRLVPHAYDQYRLRSYPTAGINGTYFYADQSADFYSTVWDFVIPCGVVALAVVVFLQQRYGGRCILPRGFGEVELYEKVPVVSNE
ncbi:hypothetical protein ABFX02_08G184600 [Erythranthe guttata]